MRLLLGTGLAGLAAASALSGSSGRIALTPLGEHAAKATVLQLSDFAPKAARRGGLVTPAPTPQEQVPCAGYPHAFAPSEPGIVVTGIAESDYVLPGIDDVDTIVQINATPAMARLAWQRWAKPAFAACLRTSIADPTIKVFSVRRLPFPKLGSFTAAYRASWGDPSDPGGQWNDDWILLSQGCARIRMLITTGRNVTWAVSKYEQELATEVVERAAGSCSGTA